MKLIYVVSAATLVAATAFTGVNAQSLKARQGMAKQDEMLVEKAASLNKDCGTTISVKFDWKDAPEAELDKYSASSFCGAALSGISRNCSSKIGKDAVQQKVKSVTCGFGGERAITMKDGAVDFKINFSSANDADFVYEFMQNNL